MGIGKTSEQETVQTVDPQLARETHGLLNLFRLIGSAGYQPNRGVTMAGFTPKQEATFDMGDAAASAFGFDVPDRSPMPATTTSAMGIEGYRPAIEYDANVRALPPQYRAIMRQFLNQFGVQTPYEQYEGDGGGGKK